MTHDKHHHKEDEKETVVETVVIETAPGTVTNVEFIDDEAGLDDPTEAAIANTASADGTPVDPTTVVHIPSADDIKDTNPSRYVSLLGIDAETLEALFEARVRLVGELKFVDNAQIADTYEYALTNAIRQTFPEILRTQDAIALVKDHKLERKLVNAEGKTILGDAVLRRNTKNFMDATPGSSLSVMRMRAGRKRGLLRRVPLYCSGFFVDIRTPNLDDLYNGLIRKCRMDHQTYGNQFGAHYYMYHDLLMVNNFAMFAIDIIQRANIKGYEKPSILLNNILFPDFAALMTHVAAAMWPEGYPDYMHCCTRPVDADHPHGCDWHMTKTMDVGEMILTDYTRMNPDAVAHMSKCRSITNEVTEDDLNTYRRNIGIVPEVVSFEELRIELKVPTVAEWIEAGEAFNSDLMNDIQSDNNKGIYEALAFRTYRMFIPWIKSITVVDDNESPLSFTDDKRDISEMLDDIQSEDLGRSDLNEKIYNYINRMQMTHIGYKVFKCPKCGFEPKTKSGYFTMDPCATFFTQSLRKLRVT